MSTLEQFASSGDADAAEPLSVDAAYYRVWRSALTASTVGTIGLELESHVVNLDALAEPVPWETLEPLPASVDRAAGHNAVSREPGGQLELSAPPQASVLAAVNGLRDDLDRVRAALAEFGVGLAQAGTDPLRPSRRMNPGDRYRAMEEHFARDRSGHPAAVMNSSASIQVNLDAGPRHAWSERVAHAHRLGPTLTAIAANSPWLHGKATGWQSSRMRGWFGLDRRRCGPVIGPVIAAGKPGTTADPATAWTRFALRAPVMFVRRGPGLSAVVPDVTFEQWVTGEVPLGDRLPTAADLDLHLTTLFPPVRMRGYLELRYLDATPARWWPAVVAVVATAMDDPVAADRTAEATERTGGLWSQAARYGLADARLAESARRCLRIVADRVPAALANDVADLAELVESGRSPADVLAERIAKVGPEAALAELARP